MTDPRRFRLQLEELSTVDGTLTRSPGAVFKHFNPTTQMIEITTLVLDLIDWDALGRPGYVDITIDSHLPGWQHDPHMPEDHVLPERGTFTE